FLPPTVPKAAGNVPAKWLDLEPIAFAELKWAAKHESGRVPFHIEATGTDYLVSSRFELAEGPQAAKSYRVAFERPGFSVRIDTRLELSSTPETWRIAWTVRASEGGKPVHDVSDVIAIPRRP